MIFIMYFLKLKINCIASSSAAYRPPPAVKNVGYAPGVWNEDMSADVDGSCKYSTEKTVVISQECVVHQFADWAVDNNY